MVIRIANTGELPYRYDLMYWIQWKQRCDSDFPFIKKKCCSLAVMFFAEMNLSAIRRCCESIFVMISYNGRDILCHLVKIKSPCQYKAFKLRH